MAVYICLCVGVDIWIICECLFIPNSSLYHTFVNEPTNESVEAFDQKVSNYKPRKYSEIERFFCMYL